jgi:hypothetical protein
MLKRRLSASVCVRLVRMGVRPSCASGRGGICERRCVIDLRRTSSGLGIRFKSIWYVCAHITPRGPHTHRGRKGRRPHLNPINPHTDSLVKDTLLARPVAVKALREHSERERERERESGSGESDQEYFRSIKDYKLKAGETVPGAAGSALRRAQADLGWVPGRNVRWFERRKLGIDRPLTWEQV